MRDDKSSYCNDSNGWLRLGCSPVRARTLAQNRSDDSVENMDAIDARAFPECERIHALQHTILWNGNIART